MKITKIEMKNFRGFEEKTRRARPELITKPNYVT